MLKKYKMESKGYNSGCQFIYVKINDLMSDILMQATKDTTS